MASGLPFAARGRTVNVALTQRSRRAIVLLLVASSLLSGCLARLVYLQLLQGAYHRSRADNNRISLLPIVADRGNILDRNGQPLATSRLARSVYLYPREQTEQQWQQTIPKLAQVLQVPAQDIWSKLKQNGYRSAMPVRISRNLSKSAFISLAEQANELPGIEVRAESSRYYPHGSVAAHALGYISEATADDLKQHPDYPPGMLVGQFGIERLANRLLEGVWGGQMLEVDATGQEVQVLGTKPAQAGENVQLTLDLDLQKTAEKALGNRRGAVVALDIKTGQVLALASGPTFDPNLFTRRITQSEWQALQDQADPFLNRALQGYPPASTFKIITTAAGIQSGKFSTDSMVGTYASINLGGTLFHEHGGGGYGVIGFRDALAFSSNTFFYQVGLQTGPEAIAEWGKRLGVGVTHLGLDGENHGWIPTPSQKQTLLKEPWYGGDTVSMAIGQGLVQMTPLEMAVMIAAIGNGGYRVKPYLQMNQAHDPTLQPEKTGLDAATIAVIKDGLTAVVQEGTAKQLNDGSIPLTAGKTGTAEVNGGEDNSLYVGFGPLNNPRIAVAVVVENGGFGAEAAVPIAHALYRTYFRPSKAATQSLSSR